MKVEIDKDLVQFIKSMAINNGNSIKKITNDLIEKGMNQDLKGELTND